MTICSLPCKTAAFIERCKNGEIANCWQKQMGRRGPKEVLTPHPGPLPVEGRGGRRGSSRGTWLDRSLAARCGQRRPTEHQNIRCAFPVPLATLAAQFA